MQSHSMKVLLREKIQRHEDESIERWRDVVGFEGFYRVSDRGRVKSTVRRVKTSNGKIGRTVPGKMLLIFSGADGRLYVNLGKDNRWKSYRVHRLVLEAFVGPCPEGMEGCHFDGDSSNNSLSNLRWDTRQGNMKDCVRHGTLVLPMCKGEDVGNAKIKNSQIPEIHAAYDAGESSIDIARRLGVTKATILHILRGKTFAESQPAKKARMRKPGGRGDRHPSAKIKASDKALIIKAFAEGETQASIAARYKVVSSTISNIINGKTWKDV